MTAKFKFPILLIFLGLPGCSNQSAEEIEKRMEEYDRHVLGSESMALAEMFCLDGELSGEGQRPVRGRDSIFSFLKSFSGVKVLEDHSYAESTRLGKDSAVQEGSYRQVAVVPPDTLHLAGRYRTIWKKVGDQWLIRKMYTYGYKKM